MRLLLDTHTFLWWVADAKELSDRATELIADGTHEVFFSVVSGWEIAIKCAIGRLDLAHPAKTFVTEQLAATGFTVLDVRLDHALEVADLPMIHSDPFDRLLVAQARCDGLTLVSRDLLLSRYPLDVAW